MGGTPRLPARLGRPVPERCTSCASGGGREEAGGRRRGRSSTARHLLGPGSVLNIGKAIGSRCRGELEGGPCTGSLQAKWRACSHNCTFFLSPLFTKGSHAAQGQEGALRKRRRPASRPLLPPPLTNRCLPACRRRRRPSPRRPPTSQMPPAWRPSACRRGRPLPPPPLQVAASLPTLLTPPTAPCPPPRVHRPVPTAGGAAGADPAGLRRHGAGAQGFAGERPAVGALRVWPGGATGPCGVSPAAGPHGLEEGCRARNACHACAAAGARPTPAGTSATRLALPASPPHSLKPCSLAEQLRLNIQARQREQRALDDAWSAWGGGGAGCWAAGGHAARAGTKHHIRAAVCTLWLQLNNIPPSHTHASAAQGQAQRGAGARRRGGGKGGGQEEEEAGGRSRAASGGRSRGRPAGRPGGGGSGRQRRQRRSSRGSLGVWRQLRSLLHGAACHTPPPLPLETAGSRVLHQ